jgi:hypothetical protein
MRHLAADIPALWTAPTTTAADRKEIIRQVVERVVVEVQGASERVRVRIDWVGGSRTEGEVLRPIAQLADLSYSAEVCERVQALTAEGLSVRAIARCLGDCTLPGGGGLSAAAGRYTLWPAGYYSDPTAVRAASPAAPHPASRWIGGG